MEPLLLSLALGGALLMALGYGLWSRYEWAEPNQWLIRIRQGKPIQAGIGIRFWRWPGDAVARFTSTMQRVTFDTEVYTHDKQEIAVKGFVLWVVSEEGDAPFRAFSKLGIAHRSATDSHDPAQHHALSRAQHHAFRRSIEAVVRKSAVQHPLRDVLSEPGLLAQQIQESLKHTIADWGIVIETTEVTDLSLSQGELFAHLQAPYIAESSKEAERVRLATEAELQQLRHVREREEAEAQQQLALEALERDAARDQRKEQQAQQLHKLQEQRHHEQLNARLQRLKLEKDAELQRLALERDAELKHLQALLDLEQQKPEAVREAELSKELLHTASEAMKALPLQEVRWLSSHPDQGPSTMVLGLVDTLQQIVQTRSHQAQKLPTPE